MIITVNNENKIINHLPTKSKEIVQKIIDNQIFGKKLNQKERQITNKLNIKVYETTRDNVYVLQQRNNVNVFKALRIVLRSMIKAKKLKNEKPEEVKPVEKIIRKLNHTEETLIFVNDSLKDSNINPIFKKVLQELFENGQVDDLQISIVSQKRKQHGFFVRVKSNNTKSIEENLFNYFNSNDIEHTKRVNNKILENLKEVA